MSEICSLEAGYEITRTGRETLLRRGCESIFPRSPHVVFSRGATRRTRGPREVQRGAWPLLHYAAVRLKRRAAITTDTAASTAMIATPFGTVGSARWSLNTARAASTA